MSPSEGVEQAGYWEAPDSPRTKHVKGQVLHSPSQSSPVVLSRRFKLRAEDIEFLSLSDSNKNLDSPTSPGPQRQAFRQQALLQQQEQLRIISPLGTSHLSQSTAHPSSDCEWTPPSLRMVHHHVHIFPATSSMDEEATPVKDIPSTTGHTPISSEKQHDAVSWKLHGVNKDILESFLRTVDDTPAFKRQARKHASVVRNRLHMDVKWKIPTISFEGKRSFRMSMVLFLIGVLMVGASFLKLSSTGKEQTSIASEHLSAAARSLAASGFENIQDFRGMKFSTERRLMLDGETKRGGADNGAGIDQVFSVAGEGSGDEIQDTRRSPPSLLSDTIAGVSSGLTALNMGQKEDEEEEDPEAGGEEYQIQDGEPRLISGSAPVPPAEEYLWEDPSAAGLEQCIARSKTHKLPAKDSTNGYLLVTANGGLNQMRAAICDMVAVARIMNVTLVVPELDHTSFWADPSDFSDVFDVDHFIKVLKKDIRIVRKLPKRLRSVTPLEKFPISWSPASYYKKELLPLMKKARVMQFPLTDSRLSNNDVPASIQRLRCRANYRALKYTPAIDAVANNLIARLRAIGPYIALHLRYEKDMLAFTGCTHGLTEGEAEELRVMRNNVSRWKEKDIDGEARRKEGACPFTPRETALFLKALGFPNRTLIYIAAGDIYGSQGLKDLAKEYPNTFTHNTLATKEELRLLGKYQNQLAAVDYSVAVESNIFMYTYEGNMAKAVQGHRRFEGHRKTIIPDRRLVVSYIDQLDAGELTWPGFVALIRSSHQDNYGGPHMRQSGENPKTEENFFANPFPGCLCDTGKLLPQHSD